MKVLFSNPPWWIENPDGIYTPKLLAGIRAGSRWPFTTVVRSKPGNFLFGEYLPYPFFMGAAATYLARATGTTVAFRDSLALREGYPAFLHYLAEQEFDYIVVESASPSWDHDAKLIREIKRLHPDCKIVVAGPIAAKGEALLADHPLHAVIQGEYEKGCVKVIEGASGLLPHDLLTEAELNAAPYPYFDPVYAYRYWDGNPKGQVPPQLQVLSSRGCPFKCIFCVWPAVMTNNDPDGSGKRVVRQYTADYMEGLLTDLVGRYGYKSVYFDDDTFNLGDRHVRDMCGVMQRIGLPWSAMCRADTIARDTWKLMRDSGCFGVKIGFESGNQWVVDNIIHKNLDLQKAREVVIHLKELGFTVHGTFTIGLPGETQEQMLETERFRKSLPLDSYQESGTAEIEGAPLATLRKTGRLSQYAGADLTGYQGEYDGTRKLQRVVLGTASLEDAARCRAQRAPALAEAICRNLLDTGGEQAPVLNLLGMLAGDVRMFDLAVRYFVRALTADPTFFGACVNLGNLLRDQGLPDEAAACFRRALELKPEAEEARLGLELLKVAPHSMSARFRTQHTAVLTALAEMPDAAWGRQLREELGRVHPAGLGGRHHPQTGPAVTARTDGPAAPPGPPERTGETAADAACVAVDPQYPRLIVLDHGMRYVAGHHLAYNLGLLIECVKRGLPVEFYVHAECKPDVVKVLRAHPVLRPSQYVTHSTDKYCSYLEDFTIASKIAEYNLYKTLKGKVDPDDIVYVHTADPKIVMGIAAWYISLSKDKRPHLCLKFQNHGYRFVVKPYKALVQSVFRMALKPFLGMDKVHFAASNKMIAAQIQLLAEKPCPVFPIPLQLAVPPRTLVAPGRGKELRIGYAGEGRAEQGVDMLPDIIETILPAYPNARFVVQLGCPFAQEQTLRRLRAFGDRVELLEKCYVGDQFHQLIRGFDALLLPYTPDRYIERSSQVVIEAIALGIPLIVPSRTSLSLEAREFDCGYALIQQHTVAAIVAAIAYFLDNNEALTAKSILAAGKCAHFHSGKTLVDMLLTTCGFSLGRDIVAGLEQESQYQ